MSRCFPFPPPGYEKKLRIEDVTLLAKEKDKEIKERRHKKDKDKDKKEGREKDRKKSKDRHKEKDKEKHTHKDRDKKNGKKRSRDEKRSEGDRSNGEKVGSNSPQSSCVQELEQRINFLDGATRSQSVHTLYDRNEGKSEFLDGVASRNNGAYWTEAKSGLDSMANGQRDNCKSKFPKIVFSNGAEQRTVQIGRPLENDINESTEGKDVQKHPNSNRKGEKSKDKNANTHKGDAEIIPQETAVVQALGRRVREENGAIGSQIVAKANVIIQKRAQNSGKVANNNATSFSHIKELSESGDGSYRLENGPKGNNQSKVPKVSIVHNNLSKVPKVAIVHNFKTEVRVYEVAGDVDTSKKSPLEGMRRNGYCGKGAIDNRKITQSKGEDGNKPRMEEKVNEESDNAVEFPRIGHNVSDSADNSKHYTFKMSDKTAEVIAGKRKEPVSNGILHDNELRPNKWQRTVLSSQPSTENRRNLKTSTTITLSASKQVPACGLRLDGEEHKSMGPTCDPSPLGLTKPFITAKANGEVSAQVSPFGPMKPPSSVGKVHRKTGSQEPHLSSTKPPSTAEKVNGTIRGHGSPPITSKAMPHMEIAHETAGCLESAKPPLTPEKVNGIIAARVSPPVAMKPSSTSGKEKHKHKSSSKPLPPHPDTKYLSQILSVPKMEILPECGDPEWLFESKMWSSKERGDGYGKDGDEQVWAKSVHIESADIYALPYVIPY